MMEKFSEEETHRLNEVLSLEVNPWLRGENGRQAVELGKITQDWLFKTQLNLPEDAKKDLEILNEKSASAEEKIRILNNVLEERQVGSAPSWWELNFFECQIDALWDFFTEQCRRQFAEKGMREYFDLILDRYKELQKARWIIWVSKANKTKFSEEEVKWALSKFDEFYPLDFCDYNEAPKKVRSPLDELRWLIADEISDVGAVFTKRWFEFKILDELAGFKDYLIDGSRDSELSRKIAAQVRSVVYGDLVSLGRMVEHYRWKFSYEEAALGGLRSAKASKARGRKGGEASSRIKTQNLQALMVELEALADLYPRMSEEAIFDQAYANASAKRKMPQTTRTIEDYGTTLRSDEEFKSRYFSIFQKNA